MIQKIFVSFYLNRRYPYLTDKNVKCLSREETGEIVLKTKALLFHKVGDVARLQTDSMIISAFLNVTLVGFVGNYNMILTSVSNFVNIIFNTSRLSVLFPKMSFASSLSAKQYIANKFLESSYSKFRLVRI